MYDNNANAADVASIDGVGTQADNDTVMDSSTTINDTIESSESQGISKKISDEAPAISLKVNAHRMVKDLGINIERYSCDDKGAGRLFADVFKSTLRYNATAKSWYYYNGCVWKQDNGGLNASYCAKELSDVMEIYALMPSRLGLNASFDERIEYAEQLKLYKHVRNLCNTQGKRNMINEARDMFPITHEDFDKNLSLYNCQNGTLDLDTLEFCEHNASDLLSKTSNVRYDPNAKSPDWEKFIGEVMCGDAEKARYLQKWCGYALTADTKLESCIILYGSTTRNGKSTFIETLSHMHGNTDGYSMNIQPESLAKKQNKDSRQTSGDIARLDGCRFLHAAEPPKKMLFDVQLLKQLLGRDKITARHLYQNEFEFIPLFKLFINTNYLPLVTDDTLFSSGRLNVVTFDRHFRHDEQDKGLKDKLKTIENISGIFNWCLDGLCLYRDEGLFPPQSVIDATDEYRQDSDKISNFFKDCMQQSSFNSKMSDVYSRFVDWCRENGYGVENKGNFIDEIKTKSYYAKSGTVDGKSYKNVIKGYTVAPPVYLANALSQQANNSINITETV
ncbi:MAG: hypothetical protein LBB56_06255 [Chitinispirillales bacterium]|jgi:putative DNA primase/helicase|nr:hypothetical protein [Chitinispirillales bacterium]